MSEEIDDAPAETTLRALATAKGLHIGAAVAAGPLASDPAYREVLGTEFSMLTAENVMKMGPLRPTPQTFSWDNSDALMDFAESNEMTVRGHALVWHQSLPSWVESANWGRQELIAILQEHIGAVVTRYRGRIAHWDVVNEAVGDDARRRPTLFNEVIGPEYLQMAFEFAHAADPDAKLFYNDYGAEGLGAKSDAVYALVQELLSTGTPLHGVGLQMHVTASNPPSMDAVRSNIRRLAALGLEVHITEMDVRIPEPATENGLVAQAQVYNDVLQLCLSEPSCTSLVFWGFTDRHSWVPSFFQGFGAALPFDEDYQPKLAYQVMQQTLMN
ncbi:MAG: endo-1,4-beta-xylanase [Rhodothermales bacterium]|nr:endo-1,4-beta-xylanase [Rhodothermales bacterium]